MKYRNCPLALEVGCQYGKTLVCPDEYQLCGFYVEDERQRLLNDLARIQLRAGELEKTFIQEELKLWEKSKNENKNMS